MKTTVVAGTIEVNGKVRHGDAWLRTTPEKALEYLRGRAQKASAWYKPKWQKNLGPTDVIVLRVYALETDSEPVIAEVYAGSHRDS